MKKIIYILLFSMASWFQQAYSQENKNKGETATIDSPSVVIKSANGVQFSGLKIRGTHGINEKSPLIILDDMVIEYAEMDVIDPNKIKSVDILKNAMAVIKYGEKAINGVIIITTKDYIPKKTIK